MTRRVLTFIFAVILLGMVVVTTYASFDRSILKAGSELMSDRWFQATLADAYFGFITFYVWVFYKERNPLLRTIWFVLIMTLGNIAMSIYVLNQLRKWDPATGIDGLLLHQSAQSVR